MKRSTIRWISFCIVAVLLLSTLAVQAWPSPNNGQAETLSDLSSAVTGPGDAQSGQQDEQITQNHQTDTQQPTAENGQNTQETTDNAGDIAQGEANGSPGNTTGTTNDTTSGGSTTNGGASGNNTGNATGGNTSSGNTSSQNKPGGTSGGNSSSGNNGSSGDSNTSGGSSSGTTGNAGSSGGSSTTTKPPATTTPAPTPTQTGKIVAGYYTSWSAYRGYTPSKIPAGKLTHLHYAFAKIDPSTNSIALADPAQDRKNFAEIRTLKQNNKQLKTLISIGGWDYSVYFSDIASTAARREAFAKSCVQFILEHGFDGVDLDWEYPVSGGLAGNTNRPQDKQNFTLLLKAIRNALDAQEKKDGRDYYLTIAGADNNGYLSKIEVTKVANIVDYIFLMAYDMHGPWDKYADLNAPLYQPQESSPQYKHSVSDGINAYLNKGVSSKKLVLGMPFYGYMYQGVSSQNNGLYSTFTSAKALRYDIIRSSYLNNSAYKQLRHADGQVPYLYGNGTFISYEDAHSIAAKVSLAKSKGLAGIGAWELSHDTSGTLLASAYNTLYARAQTAVQTQPAAVYSVESFYTKRSAFYPLAG